MTCRGVRKRISLYLDGRLPEDVRACILRHLDSCAACRSHASGLEEALRALEVLEREAPPQGGWERLLERLQERGPVAAPRRTAPVRWRPLPALAAAGAAVLAAFLLLRGPSVEDVAVAPPPAGTSVPAPALSPVTEPQEAGEIGDVQPAPPAVPAGTVKPAAPEPPAPRKARAPRIASARPAPPAPSLPAAPVAGEPAQLEPDPESYEASAGVFQDVLDEPAAELAVTGLTPLVAAAEQFADPVAWVYDISAEDWL